MTPAADSTPAVLVTGAARRLGAAIVRHLHAADLNVAIHYRHSRAEAEALAAELNARRPASAFALAADLTDSAALEQLIRDACACCGRLDVLVNNASAFFPTPFGELTEFDWSAIMEVNLKAPLFLARHAAGELRRRQGCIINLTDIYGDRPLSDYPLYSLSKAGLIMLTRILAVELAPDIRVNAVSPGAVMWPEGMAESARRRIVAQTLLKRRGEPENIANAVLFLIRDAAYMTGQVLTVDGGRLLKL